ncbi:hypothetical protein HPB49_010558 [Dermacentor silvarum]|uniref:Uncharacterized protein n=1 Tax=Dermacentor silvarum TaxID=543639 RepID=A0ACB8CWQ4_DERSI|nr:hypothetical protein HPB49_010558 [Dermacentor silvarum]
MKAAAGSTREIQNTDCYVVLFDESGDEFLHRKQMDVDVRCWNFLPNVSRPKVNLKIFRSLQVDLRENYQVKSVDLGTCGLHTVHNGYRAGVVASKRGRDVLLSSLSVLFDNSPARREDFTAIMGQNTFPLKFVSQRWVENEVSTKASTQCASDDSFYGVRAGLASVFPMERDLLDKVPVTLLFLSSSGVQYIVDAIRQNIEPDVTRNNVPQAALSIH